MDSGGGKLVFGDDAAAALASNIKSWHEDDPDDVRFSRREAAARAVEFQRLRRDVLPLECARGTAQRKRVEADAAARGDVADWRQWELEVQRGRRVPSDDELLAYFATPVRVDEVRVVARAAARRKAPSPGDWVTADVIAHGGRAVWRVLALLFSIMLATGITPPEWRVGFRRDLYKKGSRLLALMEYSRRLLAGVRACVGASVVCVRSRRVLRPLGRRRHIVQVCRDCVVAGIVSGCGAALVRVCLRWCVRVLVRSSCIWLAWVWELVWCRRRCWCGVDVHCSSRGCSASCDVAVDGVNGREELVVQNSSVYRLLRLGAEIVGEVSHPFELCELSRRAWGDPVRGACYVDHVHVLVLERDVRVQCRQRVRHDAGLRLHFSRCCLQCGFAWLALPAEILPVAGWSDAGEPSVLADEEETGSGEFDVGCVCVPCVGCVSPDGRSCRVCYLVCLSCACVVASVWV